MCNYNYGLLPVRTFLLTDCGKIYSLGDGSNKLQRIDVSAEEKGTKTAEEIELSPQGRNDTIVEC
jgi:hypothetical protein